MSKRKTRRNKDVIFPVPANVEIKKNVLARKMAGIQNYHRNELLNRVDRRKYQTRSRKSLDNYQQDLKNYRALVAAGWDVSRIYLNKDHRPLTPRLYEKSVIHEHTRVSPLKLGSRLGTKMG